MSTKKKFGAQTSAVTEEGTRSAKKRTRAPVAETLAQESLAEDYRLAWQELYIAIGTAAHHRDVKRFPAILEVMALLQTVCETLARESAPNATAEELIRRLAAGFPAARARKREAATPRGRAEAWTRQEFVANGSGYPSRIAFAVHAATYVETAFGVPPVDPQKTIVDRWLKDL